MLHLTSFTRSSLASSLDNHFLKKYACFDTSLFSSDVSGRTVSLADLMADSEDDDAVPSAKHPQLAPQKATMYVFYCLSFKLYSLSNALFSSSKRKVSQVIELSSSDSSDDSV